MTVWLLDLLMSFQKKFLEKNSFFDESVENDNFEFNQDLDTESEIRSPGWIRYQKRIK